MYSACCAPTVMTTSSADAHTPRRGSTRARICSTSDSSSRVIWSGAQSRMSSTDSVLLQHSRQSAVGNSAASNCPYRNGYGYCCQSAGLTMWRCAVTRTRNRRFQSGGDPASAASGTAWRAPRPAIISALTKCPLRWRETR